MKHQLASPARRDFLAGAVATALAPFEARNSTYNPTLVAQTYIWLQEMQSRNKPLAEGVEEAFAGIRRAGYNRIELMPAFLAREIREKTLNLLHQNKLEPTIVYFSGPLHTREQGERSRAQVLEIARIAKDAGTLFINFSPVAAPRDEPKTDAELEAQSYQLNRLGDELHGLSMQLLLHHHVAEMRDQAREWRYCAKHTESKLVLFCLDPDWAARAGVDPLLLVREAGERLESLHVRNSRKGIELEEVADGDINVPAIARALRQMFYDGFLVVELVYDKETQRTHPLPVALSRSRYYMQKVFGTRPGNPPVNMGPHVRTGG